VQNAGNTAGTKNSGTDAVTSVNRSIARASAVKSVSALARAAYSSATRCTIDPVVGRHQPIQEPGEHEDRVQIGVEGLVEPRALHLDGHGAVTGQQPAPVHLGDRRRRHGLVGERGEHLADRPAELPLDQLPGERAGKGRDGGLELRQLLEERRGEQVDAGRQHLAELHERGAEPLERAPQPRGHLGAGRRLLRAVGGGEPAQALLGEDPDDGAGAAQVHVRGAYSLCR
jgi:hypothetical protein